MAASLIRPMAGSARACFLLFFAAAALLQAQARGGRGPAGPPPAAQAAAPVDLTGYWVSLVTEDWRFRMVTPPKGDFSSVPLNQEGQRVANAWDPDKDIAAGEQCKSYGAAAVMRVPERLHITWATENTLRTDTDSGSQPGRPRRLRSGRRRARRRGWRWRRWRWSASCGGSGAWSGACARRLSQSCHHPHARRVSAQERRAVQRQHHAHGVFRPHQRVRRQ